jgi:hypothetical protein
VRRATALVDWHLHSGCQPSSEERACTPRRVRCVGQTPILQTRLTAVKDRRGEFLGLFTLEFKGELQFLNGSMPVTLKLLETVK